MKIEEMKLDDIKARKAEIVARRDAMNAELETADDAALDALKAEAEQLGEEERQLNEREAAIYQAAEERRKEIEEIERAGNIKEEFSKERKMSDLEVRKSHEYNMAYAEYIKTGDDSECRALLTENVSGGKVPVATYAEDRVRTAWNRNGIMALVRKTYLKGNLKVGFEVSADGAYAHTEGSGAVTEESLVLGTTTLLPVSLKKYIQLSDEVMDMKGEEFIDYVVDELTYRIAKKAAEELLAKIKACTSVSTDNAPAVDSITATTISSGLIAQALSHLSDEAANPVAVMNKLTWGAFKDAEAKASYAHDPFEGLPVIFDNSLPAFSAATTGVCYAIVGDFGIGAQANFPNGDEIQIKIDELSKMEYDLVRFLGRQYVGLGVVAPNAFAMIKH